VAAAIKYIYIYQTIYSFEFLVEWAMHQRAGLSHFNIWKKKSFIWIDSFHLGFYFSSSSCEQTSSFIIMIICVLFHLIVWRNVYFSFHLSSFRLSFSFYSISVVPVTIFAWLHRLFSYFIRPDIVFACSPGAVNGVFQWRCALASVSRAPKRNTLMHSFQISLKKKIPNQSYQKRIFKKINQ